MHLAEELKNRNDRNLRPYGANSLLILGECSSVCLVRMFRHSVTYRSQANARLHGRTASVIGLCSEGSYRESSNGKQGRVKCKSRIEVSNGRLEWKLECKPKWKLGRRKSRYAVGLVVEATCCRWSGSWESLPPFLHHTVCALVCSPSMANRWPELSSIACKRLERPACVSHTHSDWVGSTQCAPGCGPIYSTLPGSGGWLMFVNTDHALPTTFFLRIAFCCRSQSTAQKPTYLLYFHFPFGGTVSSLPVTSSRRINR